MKKEDMKYIKNFMSWLDGNASVSDDDEDYYTMCKLNIRHLLKQTNETNTSNKSEKTCSNCYYLPKEFDSYCDNCSGINKFKQV